MSRYRYINRKLKQTLAEGSELRIYEECPLETSGAMLYPDLPVDFSSREFRPRAVEER